MKYTIHTFGDSNSKFGWEKIQHPDLDIQIHHKSFTLCYSFGRDQLNRINISDPQFNLKKDDIVIFSLGGIDCRCHIQKYITKEKNYKDIIDPIIENYIKAINLNLENLNFSVKPFIFNVLPPVKKNSVKEYPGYPHLGTDNERLIYRKYFNKRLRYMASKHNIGFLDIYKYYANKDGFLNPKLSDGRVHIDDPKFLQQELLKLLY